MSKIGDSNVPEFLSTHPSYNTRINDLKEYVKLTMPYYQNYKIR